MKKFIAIIPLCLFAFSLFAQSDIDNKIEASRKSGDALVQNNRAQIIDNLNKKQYSDLLKIVDETNSLIDTSNTTAFYAWEIQVLSVLSNDLTRFFKATENFQAIYQSIGFEYDNLGYIAIAQIIEDGQYWNEWYENLYQSDEEMLVLKIFFGSIGLFSNNIENKKSVKEFRHEYPTSDYLDFVNLRASLFSTGSWDWHIGYSYINLSGDVSKITTPGSSFMMGTSGLINELFFSIYFTTGKSKILYDIPSIIPETGPDFSIETGEELRYVNIGAKFGWLAYKQQFIKLIPNISISSLSINIPPKTDRNIEPYVLNASTGFGLGLVADFDIFSWNSKPQYGKSTSSHLGFRLSGNYIRYIARDSYLDGSATTGEISLIWWIGD